MPPQRFCLPGGLSHRDAGGKPGHPGRRAPAPGHRRLPRHRARAVDDRGAEGSRHDGGAAAGPHDGREHAADAGSGSAVDQVLQQINDARAQAGLPDYTITAGLSTSADRHNSAMADGCGLSHQCPGEPPLGDRETDAGVDWSIAGENVGEGGQVADSPDAIAQMARELTRAMLNERPPDDGHRKNILSSAFHHIGIAIFRDRHGTVWLTQDFSN